MSLPPTRGSAIRRAAHYIEVASETNISGSAFEAWTRIFDVAAAAPHDSGAFERQVNAVIDQLLTLRQQLVDALDELQRDNRFSAALYERPIRQALLAAHPQFLSQPWPSAKAQLERDVVTSLLILAQASPAHELDISREDVNELAELINALEQAIADTEMEAEAKVLFLRQVARMRQGLREYPLRGIEALTDAFAISVVDTSRSIVTTPTTSPIMDRLKAVWTKIQTISTVVHTGQTLLAAGAAIADQIGPATDAIRRIAGPG